jgi:amidase
LRPTRGRVSRHGTFPLAETLDSIGPIARHASDAALVFAAIAGEDPADPTTFRMPPPGLDEVLGTAAKGLRIGMAEAFLDADTDPEVRNAMTAAATVLEGMGASLQPVVLPMIDEAVAAWSTAFVAECLVAHESHFPARADELSEALRLFLEQGQAVSGADYVKTHNVRFGLRRRFDYIFDDFDLILLPTMGCLPPSLAEFPADGIIPAESARGLLRFTAPFALTGHPAISVPCGFSKSGLPIGMQLVGRFATEPVLLKAAAAYQGCTSWHLRRPPVAGGDT